MATCPKCLRDVPKLTRDHTLPRWLWEKLPLLGARQPAAWIEMMCAPCNQAKGGRIDWQDARTREVLRHLAVRLIEQCYEAEKDIRDGVTIEREKEKHTGARGKKIRVSPGGKKFVEGAYGLAEALRQLEGESAGDAARLPGAPIAPPEVLAEIDREHARRKKRRKVLRQPATVPRDSARPASPNVGAGA